MPKNAENYTTRDPSLLSAQLELWEYCHNLQKRYNVPLSPVQLQISGPAIMAALYKSFQLQQPEIPKTKTDAIAFLQGRLEAQLESGQGGAAEAGDIYGGHVPDYIDSSSGSGNRRRMRTDSAQGNEARARYAARIEANGGQRGRRASAATGGGEGLRTDSAPVIHWQRGADGRLHADLNALNPITATPTTPRTDEAETNPAAAGDSHAPASYTARIESGGKGKRKPKFHHS